MAKLIGAVKFVGKFNDAVGMRSKRGKSFVRSAAASIANPRSIGQNVQRMILATAGQSIGYLKEICNNSVEGKANGNDTLSYLRSQWMRMLRVSDINSSPYNYAKKGSGIFITNPYLLSKGSLFVPQYSCDGSTFSVICEEINAVATKPSELFPSIAVGNQITIVAVASDDRDLEQESPYIPVIKYCRFAFKNDAANPLVSGNTLNPDAIDLNKAQGDWNKLVFTNGSIELQGFIDNLDLAACAIIVSNIAEKKRSTSYLALADNILGLQWPAAEAYPTYGNVSTPIDVPSEVYLDNSTTPQTSEISGVVELTGAPVVVEGSPTTLNFTGMTSQPTQVKLKMAYDGQENLSTNIVDVVVGAPVITLPGGAAVSVAQNGAFSYNDGVASIKLFAENSDFAWVVSGGFMVIDGVTYTF